MCTTLKLYNSCGTHIATIVETENGDHELHTLEGKSIDIAAETATGVLEIFIILDNETREAVPLTGQLLERSLSYGKYLQALETSRKLDKEQKPATPVRWTYVVSRKSSTSEYVTRFFLNGCERKQARNYTDCREDAEQTGRIECERLNKEQYLPETVQSV